MRYRCDKYDTNHLRFETLPANLLILILGIVFYPASGILVGLYRGVVDWFADARDVYRIFIKEERR